MRNKIVFVSLLLLLSFINLFSQVKVKEVNEPEGKFSYSIPSSWTISKIDGMQYQIARDKAINGFSSNINILQEKNKYTFAEYYKLNIEELKKFSTDFSELTSEEFVTAAGLKGKKMVCTHKQIGKHLMQAFYFFEDKDKSKIIITGSSLIEDKDKYLPIFDSIVKSFKSTK